MATSVLTGGESMDSARGPRLDSPGHPAGRWLFGALVIGGLGYAGMNIVSDTALAGEQMAMGVFLFLALALVIALGFEFVNGFHDTANAVATVIYTNSLSPAVAVVWSGVWNFVGVMVSSGAVAYSIITLLPVDLILHIGSTGGFAMIFALLFAAVIWNLATWYVGLPNSSSHALIGSILGVGLANQLINGAGGTAGVEWGQAQKVLTGLMMAPVLGFAGAMLLLYVMRKLLPNPTLYRAPEADAPPPRGIRALLVFTCTAVSFAHGSNDGQKGMGLIMLILIGCAPTAYALNRTVPDSATPAFVQVATRAQAAFAAHGTPPVDMETARVTVTRALQTKQATTPAVMGSLAAMSGNLAARIGGYGSLSRVPAAATPNLRNDMYLALDTTRLVLASEKQTPMLTDADTTALKDYSARLEDGTRFIPLWVKVTVALALGLGTMVGWKRIVVTIGERIGTSHLTYGMGAAAELTAASMILIADRYGLPVSTTHVLSSGVAGASVASGAGLQRRTVTNMALAWIMTLPAAMLLAGGLYWVLLGIVRALGI